MPHSPKLIPAISAHGEQQYDHSDACGLLDPTSLLGMGSLVDHPPTEYYANPPGLEDQVPYPSCSISETGPPFLPVPVASNNPQIVLDRQRKQPQPREKTGFICGFRGDECPFMATKDNRVRVFKDIAMLKYVIKSTFVLKLLTKEHREDALRHLNPFQCKKCGQRFGKRYGLSRHGKDKIPCMQRPVKQGVWISQELEAAVEALEKAKGYDKVIMAIDVCKQFYGGYSLHDHVTRVFN